jgi:hypothetical protein
MTMSRTTRFWINVAVLAGAITAPTIAMAQDGPLGTGYPQPATPLPGMPARPGYFGLPCEGGPVARYLNDQFARNRIYRYQQAKALRGESVYFACPPYRNPGWGYYPTCWRRAVECNRCPPTDQFLDPIIAPSNVPGSMQPLSVPPPAAE